MENAELNAKIAGLEGLSSALEARLQISNHHLAEARASAKGEAIKSDYEQTVARMITETGSRAIQEHEQHSQMVGAGTTRQSTQHFSI